ncbi:epimerase [Actinosynnema sp. ALI-1.44]|uniref:NAD-dependent epimerase/dehydratase family protein n=1 Tax=Actinosynnema sp. ALI-1.44 TaxID=1933779 RepID=UPI00097CB502|nr:NAD-dependent epimerase/dehydratase family protein [Actinosynnema sp. ALI-1.44]ONI76352.1 epimerase [Actinosynnema sp. ALI-1.44]
MSHTVVTGGCGFIGSHLVERLVRDGHRVVVYDPAPLPPGIEGIAEHVRADILDERRVSEVVDSADTVYHLSAMVGVDRYLARPLDVIEVNVLGSRNVLRAVHATGAKVVMASTSEVYGRNPAIPWAEDADRVLGSTTADRWTYSSSKAVVEHMTYGFARQHGVRASTVRYFNVYGPRQRPAYVVSRTIHRLLTGKPALVYDGGRQTRCFTYVADAIEATVCLADNSEADGQVFNIGSDQETSIGEIARLATHLIGGTVSSVDTAHTLGERYEDIERRVPDVSKAKAVLGWRATTEVAEGLATTIEWARGARWWLALTS